MPDVVRPCVLTKGDDGMSRLTSSDHLCFPSTMMACHARHRSAVNIAQDSSELVTLDVIRLCILTLGDDNMFMFAVQGRYWPAMPDVVLSYVLAKGYDGIPGPA